jgi:hypothetical protein
MWQRAVKAQTQLTFVLQRGRRRKPDFVLVGAIPLAAASFPLLPSRGFRHPADWQKHEGLDRKT